MLENSKIEDVAGAVARRQISSADLKRVLVELTSDSGGRDALRITLVLDPNAVSAMTGEQALDILFNMQKTLRAEGEDRFPIVEYATEEELLQEDEIGPASDDRGRGA